MAQALALVRRTLVAVGFVGCVVVGAVVGGPHGGAAAVGEEETPAPGVAGIAAVEAPPALAAATATSLVGAGPVSQGDGDNTGPSDPALAACPADATATDDPSVARDTVDLSPRGRFASRWDWRLTERARRAEQAAELGYSAMVYDLGVAHRDATGPATSWVATDLSGAKIHDAAGKRARLEAALTAWPRAVVQIESIAPGLSLRITAPTAARGTIEAALDRIASVDGPVARLLVEDLDASGAAVDAVAALCLDAPRSHPVSATGGRARIACGGLDLEVGQESFLYTPLFDLVRDGLDVSAGWDRDGGADVVRVSLSLERSFDRSSADGGKPDVPVAQDAPFAPPELIAPLTHRALTRAFATAAVPAVEGAAVEAACGERRYRITVIELDDSAPVRRGWARADVKLAEGGYVPPDVETLDVVVDRPVAAGGPVAGRVDLVGGTPVDVVLVPSSLRDADVGDPTDATVRELAGLARSLTTPLAVRAAACDADPERPERNFDLCLTVADDDVTWDPLDVPAPWGTDALRRREPVEVRSLRRPVVTSVVLPLRVRLGPGDEVCRVLTIDRGHGPERWSLTVARRAPRGG